MSVSPVIGTTNAKVILKLVEFSVDTEGKVGHLCFSEGSFEEGFPLLVIVVGKTTAFISFLILCKLFFYLRAGSQPWLYHVL